MTAAELTAGRIGDGGPARRLMSGIPGDEYVGNDRSPRVPDHSLPVGAVAAGLGGPPLGQVAAGWHAALHLATSISSIRSTPTTPL